MILAQVIDSSKRMSSLNASAACQGPKLALQFNFSIVYMGLWFVWQAHLGIEA